MQLLHKAVEDCFLNYRPRLQKLEIGKASFNKREFVLSITWLLCVFSMNEINQQYTSRLKILMWSITDVVYLNDFLNMCSKSFSSFTENGSRFGWWHWWGYYSFTCTRQTNISRKFTLSTISLINRMKFVYHITLERYKREIV